MEVARWLVAGRWRAWLALWMVLGPALWLCTPHMALACSDGGCVAAGPRLASVSSGRSVLLNGLLGQMAGTNLNLSMADWNALATADLGLLKLLTALQSQLGVASPTTALQAQVSLSQLVAAAGAATGGGQASAVAALGSLQSQLGLLAGTVRLGDLLVTDGGLGDTRINALALVTGALQLYNTRNVATTSTPVMLSGTSLGLGSVLQGVQLSAQVVEPPVYVCGPAGSSFHTAALRVRLGLDLVALDVNTGLLTALVGVSSASLQLAHLDLYVEVARADGILSVVDAVAGALTVQVAPGVADVYIGQISDAVFYSRSRAIQPATDLSPAVVGALKLNGVNVGVTLRGRARGQAPSATSLFFSSPYPQTRTAYTQAGFANALLASLVGSFEVGVTPSLGALDAVVLPVLRTLVQTSLSPVLGNLLGSLVNPLLELLGVRLGEVDVTAGGSFRVCGITGSVYADQNHDARRGPTESGTGLALYAKLVPATQTAGPAVAVAIVDPQTGNYAFSRVGVGSYLVVVNGSGSVTQVTPAVPAGWLGTEAGGFSRSFSLTAELADQHFGVYAGSTLAGRVHLDTGVGGGIANNGLREGDEPPLQGSVIRLLDAGGQQEIDRAATGQDGSFLLWLPTGSVGAVQVVQQGGAAWVSTGGSAGSTGGSYVLTTDRSSFVAAAGQRYVGIDFADVPASRLDTEGQQTTSPGTVVFYPHRFTAGTAGTLSLQGAPAAAAPGWTAQVYEDLDCNGRLDAGEAVLVPGRTLVGGQSVCVVVKVQVPPEASPGQRTAWVLTARFSLANSALVAEHAQADVTAVSDPAQAALRLSKQVDVTSALPGDMLTYTIVYVNQGAASLQAVVLRDSTPAYTSFVDADCGTSSPASPPLPACVVLTQPAAGSSGLVAWMLDGDLLPGARGAVRLRVRVH